MLAMTTPTNCHNCIFAGVAPVKCATFNSDMKLPATPIVVAKKAAIIKIAIIPVVPPIPTADKITALIKIMKIVMPDTGSLPVNAMELIPTTDNKNDKINTIKKAKTVCRNVSA